MSDEDQVGADKQAYVTPEVDALRFYANPWNWEMVPDADSRGMHNQVELDKGDKAREALQDYRPRHLVTAVPVIVDNGRFLTSRRKHPSGKGLYACPGGSVEFDETPLQAAVRETREETGIELNPLKGVLIDVDTDANPVVGPWVVVFYRFQLPADVKAENKDPENHEAWEWYPLIRPPQPMMPNLAAMLKKYGSTLGGAMGIHE